MIKKLILASSLLVTSIFSAEYPAYTNYTSDWAERILNSLPFGVILNSTTYKDVEHELKVKGYDLGYDYYCRQAYKSEYITFCEHLSDAKLSRFKYNDEDSSKLSRKLQPFYIGMKKESLEKALEKAFPNEMAMSKSGRYEIYLTNDILAIFRYTKDSGVYEIVFKYLK
jgi:hypothetical protein